MKLIKSLLLASAAGFVATAGANAADLGVKKPTAVQYVKTCPTYGAGYFVIPGTENCLKIVGRVRADYFMNENRGARSADKNTFRARGYFGYDHRGATEYGLLRTYLRAYIQRDNANAATAVLEYALIQFGGLTVGRVAPVFEHGYSFALDGPFGFSDISYINSIGYTHSFGGGFSATLALDSAAERNGTLTNSTALGGVAVSRGGQSMPDIVGSLDYNQSWGSIKLTGAIHQNRAQITATNVAASTTYGYAVALAGKFNLSMLNPGSNVWASVSYASGANSYINGRSLAVGGYQSLAVADAVSTTTAGKLKNTVGYGIAGGIQAYVTKTVYVGLTGGYVSLNPAGASNNVSAYSASLGLGWVPVSGFQIVAEGGYQSLSLGSAIKVAGTKSSGYIGRLRFQRDF